MLPLKLHDWFRMPRRRGAMLAVSLLIALAGCASRYSPPAPPRIGAQLYTVRAELERDFDGTLRRIAAMGFDEVEFAGLFGRSPQSVRALTKRLDLEVVGAHVDWRQLRDDPQRAIADTRALGSPTLVLAWLPEEQRRTLVQWRWWVAHLNRVGAMARREGVRVAYHAHDFEYRAIDGVRPIDVLIDGLDPRLVDFEIDFYWTVRAGEEPLALFARHPGRFPLAHVKDMAANGSMADVGDGTIDFGAILARSRQAGLRHYLVERDDSPDPMLTLERGLAALRRLIGTPGAPSLAPVAADG